MRRDGLTGAPQYRKQVTDESRGAAD